METIDVEFGHLVHPEGGPHPGVVMVHDVWGVSDHTRDLAQRLASEGFSVLALDLYRRKGDWKIENPGVWMRALSDPEAVADVQAAIDFLMGHTASRGCKVGVTGFCMGGMYALLAACACRGLSAAVPFYGLLSHEHGILFDENGLDAALKPRQPIDAANDLACPLLAFFGDEDEFIPASDIAQLKQRLAKLDQPSDVVIYPGAGHAFMNESRPEAYRAGAASDAWSRTVAFLRAHLSG
jgi:carboxymethylenebutenolidase